MRSILEGSSWRGPDLPLCLLVWEACEVLQRSPSRAWEACEVLQGGFWLCFCVIGDEYSLYFPLYFLSAEEDTDSMAGKKKTFMKDIRASHDTELVANTLNEKSSFCSRKRGPSSPASPPSETPGLASLEVESSIFLDLTLEEPGVRPSGSLGVPSHGSPTTTRGSHLHAHVCQPSGSKADVSPTSSPNALPISSGEGYKSDHPFFVNTPYTLPSRVQITDNSTSHTISSLAANMFKNCMVRPEVLGAMRVHSPMHLHDQLAHYQLRESVLEKEALTLKLSEAERSAVADASSDFSGIAAHFKRYVTDLRDEFVTELFNDLPDEEHEDDEEGGDVIGPDQEQDEGDDE
ncbi:hypothetical protein LIER_14832 [Lithospermum erythrorhizon]|uniref:Uncharacterized protein n=1 Tax=Lithospermum erythrorhizon TaxID=34254 RepID=A0AAV3Q4N1_LITER